MVELLTHVCFLGGPGSDTLKEVDLKVMSPSTCHNSQICYLPPDPNSRNNHCTVSYLFKVSDCLKCHVGGYESRDYKN